MASKVRLTMVIGHNPVTGAPIRKNFYGKTKKECQKKMDAYKIEAATGMKQQTGITTFGCWADQWLAIYKEDTVSDSSYRGYRLCIDHLNAAFGNQPIGAITPIMMQKFFKQKSNLSQSMVSKLRNTASAIFETAIDNDLAFRNPVRNIKNVKGKEPSPKRYYSPEDAATVKMLAKDCEDGLGAYIILNTGLRRGELMGLRPTEDIDLKNNLLYVRRTIQEFGGVVKIKDTLKNGDAQRIVPLPNDFVEAIGSNDHVMGCDGFLFKAQKSRYGSDFPLAPTNWAHRNLKRFYAFMDQELIDTGRTIEHLNPHELRHTYGTLLYKAGTDPFTIQKIMGHHSIEVTTGIYIHDDITDTQNRVIFPT